MDKKKKRRLKTAIALTCSLAALSYVMYEPEYDPCYSIIAQENGPFGYYSNGFVYIGNEEFINSIKDQVNENDVLIVMGYYVKNGKQDPSAKIISSYKIEDKKQMTEILSVLEIYSRINESDWDRSLKSMRVEWICHNILYNLNYKRNRTEDVDLNNDDEKIYSNPVLQHIIK